MMRLSCSGLDCWIMIVITATQSYLSKNCQTCNSLKNWHHAEDTLGNVIRRRRHMKIIYSRQVSEPWWPGENNTKNHLDCRAETERIPGPLQHLEMDWMPSIWARRASWCWDRKILPSWCQLVDNSSIIVQSLNFTTIVEPQLRPDYPLLFFVVISCLFVCCGDEIYVLNMFSSEGFFCDWKIGVISLY